MLALAPMVVEVDVGAPVVPSVVGSPVAGPVEVAAAPPLEPLVASPVPS